MTTKLILFFLSLLVVQCKDADPGTSNTGKPSPADTTKKRQPVSGRKNFLNKIVVEESGGFQIAAAYLSDEKGNLVNPQNNVPLGRAVYLTLQIKKGWQAKKGLVFPGAAQIITTNKGEPVVRSADLFAGLQGLKATDASTIRIKAQITVTRSDIAYYVVQFRVWDKNGTGSADGVYHLTIRE